MAMASSANVNRAQIRIATWWAAIAAFPCLAAIAVISTSTACSASVRSTRDAPARADARRPAVSGRRPTPARRAPRPTTAR